MKSVFTKIIPDCFFGGPSAFMPLWGGDGFFAPYANPSTSGRHPWSLTGTFRNLKVWLPTVSAANTTVTIAKSGVDTACTVTVLAGQTTGQDITHDIACTAGADDWSIHISGTNGVSTGVSYSVEFDTGSGDTGSSGGGTNGFAGTINAGGAVVAGALGNGYTSGWTGSSPTTVASGGDSLCGITGHVTRLDAKTYSGAPGAKSWLCYMALNGVLQDGTGGTVNTLATITGGATTAFSTFSLPIAPFDIVNIVVIAAGGTFSFATNHVVCSCAVVSDTAGQFNICGGNNNALLPGPNTTAYTWLQADQNNGTELLAQSVIGASGILAVGLYTNRNHAPGTGGSTKSYTDTLRKNGVDTLLTSTMMGTTTTALVSGVVSLVADDLIDLQIVPANTPTSSQLHWVLVAKVGSPPTPPVPSGTTLQTRRVRRFQLPVTENQRVFLQRIEFLLQVGMGLSGPLTVQGSDPILMLRLSRDGGQTWGPERQLHVGRIGQYRVRAFAYQLGYYRDGVAEIAMTDPVPWFFYGCTVDVKKGTS